MTLQPDDQMELPDLKGLLDWRLNNPRPIYRAVSAEPVSSKLRQQLEGWEPKRRWVSVSQLGSCAKKLAYRRESAPVERTLDARSKRVFAHGSMAEWWMCAILEDALHSSGLPWRLSEWNPQRASSIQLGSLEINGHADGLLEYNNGGEWSGRAILEVKSSNSFAFSRWCKEGLSQDDPYWWQCQGYMMAQGVDYGYFLAECKNSQALYGQWLRRDASFPERLEQHLHNANLPADMAPRQLPDRVQLVPVPSLYRRKTAKREIGSPKANHFRLPWQCIYCDYSKRCWGSLIVERLDVNWSGTPTRSLYMPDPDCADHPRGCPCVGCSMKPPPTRPTSGSIQPLSEAPC